MEVLDDLYEWKELQNRFSESNLFSMLIEEASIKKVKKSISYDEMITSSNKGGKVYYIIDGITIVENEKNILYFVGRGSFLGLESLFYGNEDSADIKMRPIGTIEVWEFEKKEIVYFLMSMQEGWLFGYLISQSRINKLLEIVKNLHLNPIERGKTMVLLLVEEFGVKRDRGGYLPKAFTVGMLTNYLGTSYVTMKKIVEELNEEHIQLGYTRKS